MKTLFKIIFLTFLILNLCSSDIGAQSFIGKQRSINFSTEELMILAGDKFMEDPNPEDIARYFFAMSVNDLLQKAGIAEMEPEVEESTLYFSGKKVRIDTGSETDKSSFIMRMDERKIYQIMWEQKKYMVMSMDEIAEMQKQAQAALKNLGGMEDMLDKLPPEARAQLQASLGKTAVKSEPPKVSVTGRTAKLNGFDCEEYMVKAGSSQSQYWVSKKYPALQKAYQIMINEMPDFEGSGEGVNEKEVWRQIPDGWPVVSKEFEFDMMSMGGSLYIDEMLSLEEKAVAPGTFDIPENFDQITMQEMMQGGIKY